MAPKRLLEEAAMEADLREPDEKRLKSTPSLYTVIREAMMAQSFKRLCAAIEAAIEPTLRRVVQEEMEIFITRMSLSRKFFRSPSLTVRAVEASATLQLMFTNTLALPVFTGTKLADKEGNPLEIRLIDTKDPERAPFSHPSPIKVEIVVIGGDFPGDHCEAGWTFKEFETKILKPRDGRRPLLAGGEVVVTLREGVASIGNIEITDNSKWVRSQTFSLAAKVADGSSQGMRIIEAIIGPFQVRDRRGESYRKHYPPRLVDEVWRLKSIAKDGVFHKKLTAKNILTVEEFLKTWVIDPAYLRSILEGIADKMWEATIRHARTCDLGNKRYLHQEQNSTILLNPICEVVEALINGHTYSSEALTGFLKNYVDRMVLDAYNSWSTLQVVDAPLGLNALLPGLAIGGQGEGFHNQEFGENNNRMEFGDGGGGYDAVAPAPLPPNNQQFGFDHFYMPDSSPGGERNSSPPPGEFFSGA